MVVSGYSAKAVREINLLYYGQMYWLNPKKHQLLPIERQGTVLEQNVQAEKHPTVS